MSTNILILHNIRSVLNTGALFRTADAIGIDKIYLTGYTPTPLDRFERVRYDFKKASVGAYEFVEWEHKKALTPTLRKLKKEGYKVFAIEQSCDSIDYKKAVITERNVFVLGNEIRGISKSVLKVADSILELPMKGKKESLNVATTGGIVMFRLLDN